MGDYPEWKKYRYVFLGSGGLLEYRNKYFMITNYHVVKDIPFDERLDRIIVPTVREGEDKASFVDHAEDIDNDLAAFEISIKELYRYKDKGFLSNDKLELNPVSYLENICNNVLLHGFPSKRSEIDYDKNIAEITTFPFSTFAKGYDEYADIIEVDACLEGINEFGKLDEVPILNGMSGSFAYSIFGGFFPYKCFGILSNGDRDTGNMWVIPINQVLMLIENSFFNKH